MHYKFIIYQYIYKIILLIYSIVVENIVNLIVKNFVYEVWPIFRITKSCSFQHVLHDFSQHFRGDGTDLITNIVIQFKDGFSNSPKDKSLEMSNPANTVTN